MKKILLAILLFLPIVAFALPADRYEQNVLPFQNDTYTLGTTSKQWLNVFTKNLTVGTTTAGCAQLSSSGLLYSTGSNCASGSALSGGSPNTLTYWTGTSTIGATSSPTVGSIIATSTGTSTFTGGISMARLNVTGSTTFAGMTANSMLYLNGSKTLSPVSFGAIGSSPNANGLSFTNGVFNLQPASASFGGVVTTGTQTFAGSKTFNSAPTLTSFSAGSVLFSGTGGLISQDNSNFYWNDSLNYLGINASGGNPNAPLDVRFGNSYTISFSGSVTLAAVAEELVPAPSSSDITSVVNEISDTPNVSSVTQNTGSGSYVAQGQTINYSVYSCKTINFVEYCTQAGTGGMTDAINDFTTNFYNSISWSISSGFPDRFIVCNDQGYCQDVGGSTSVDDYGFGSWSSGSGVSFSPTYGFLSAGGTRNLKLHTVSTAPSASTYYSTVYNHSVTEPASGVYYTVSHTINSVPTGAGSFDIGSSVKILGAEDGASFSNSYTIGTGSFEEAPGFWSLQSSDVTVTPQSYGITGSGQTLKYRTRPKANVRGYSDIYSGTALSSNNLTIPNTGLKYYVTITTPTPTFNGPSGALQAWYYMFERSSNDGATFPSYRNAVNASTNWITSTYYEDILTATTSGSYSASPASFAPAAAVFKSIGGTASPFSSTAGYELSLVVDSNSTSNYSGIEFRNGGNRSAGFESLGSSLTMDVSGSFVIKNLSSGLNYASFTSGQVQIGASNNTTIFNVPNATGQLFYANPSSNTVNIGASSGNGMLNVNGYSSLSSALFGLNLTSTSTQPYIQINKNNSTTGQLTSNGVWNIQDGTATTSAYSFINDVDTGMYRLTTNKLGLTTNGTNALVIDASQRVGIGSTTPSKTLVVESGTGTTTIVHGSPSKPSCDQYYSGNGTAYYTYMSNAGALTTVAGVCP